MNIQSPLQLEGVTVTVPDGRSRRTILAEVELSLSPGETVSLTGPSGSGKSTLLSVAGLLRPADEGSVTIGGQRADTMRDRARTRLRREFVSFIYQSANLLPSLTAREQLELMAHIRKEPKKEARNRAEQLLDAVGLGGRGEQLPGELSGGERQRIGIARALMCRPAVILADEPTASLDPDLADDINRLLAEHTRASGIATLLVTHDEVAADAADRRLHLVEGRLESPPAK